MGNGEHLAILRQGSEAWNEWRKTSSEIPDLSDLNLAGWDLRDVDFSYANLKCTSFEKAALSNTSFTGANLEQADLRWANVFRANFRDANLRRADLSHSRLTNAELCGVDLSDAVLTETNLNAADLTEVNLSRTDLLLATFSGANLNRTIFVEAAVAGAIFSNVDLSSATGLESARQDGPSSIGIDTVARSHGNIPELFLRRAGVPDSFITYAKSLVGSAIEFYSCFISYSTLDQKFADRLYADLQANGVRCWFAAHDLKGGRKLHEQIDEAIRVHEKVLLILSHNSMASEWVTTEISKARKREVRESARVLFPISLVPFEKIREWECFDADTGKDSAREIREYFIPDFSNWKDHDSYQKAFDRLLKDLQAAPAKSH